MKEWGKYKPDWLDIQCTKVFESLKDVDNIYDKVSIIEQVLDYLKHERAETLRGNHLAG